MSEETPTTTTPPSTETQQPPQESHQQQQQSTTTENQPNIKENLIELEIDGIKKTFKPQQLLNVIKSYEDLSSKAKEFTASQQQMQNLFQSLKENPEALWDFAESLGHDPRELTKNQFKKYLAYEKMTPEQKKVFDLERKLSSYEKEKQQYEEEMQAQKQEQLIERYYQNLEKEFSDFYKESKITPSKELAQDLIRIQREQLELTGKRPSVKEAYTQLEKKNANLRKKLLEQLDTEDLPQELIKKIQKKIAQDARKFPPNKISSKEATSNKQQSSSKTRKKPLSINDFFK